jgi:hypothetical protein
MTPRRGPGKQAGDRQRPLTPAEIIAARDEATSPAPEVLGHLYQAMLKTPEFTLQDGRKCKVDAYYAPEVDPEGNLKCGIDVVIDDGSHLEFTVGNTGWGKPIGANVTHKKAGGGPNR